MMNSMMFTDEDLSRFLRLHGVRQFKVHQAGFLHLRVILNKGPHCTSISYMQYVINQIKPFALTIELLEVEEFLR